MLQTKSLLFSFRFSQKPQIGKFAECAADLSYVKIACAAVFVSQNNSSIVSFCCFTRLLTRNHCVTAHSIARCDRSSAQGSLFAQSFFSLP